MTNRLRRAKAAHRTRDPRGSDPASIEDEVYRRELLALAERFAEIGDAALRYDGERVL